MFVSAGGLNVLVEFLDEDYDSARDLVLIGVNGIWNVFELQVSCEESLNKRAVTDVNARALPRRMISAEYFQEAKFSIL